MSFEKITEQNREWIDETFEKLDPGLYARGVFGMFGGESQSVLLRCEESVAGAMLDKFGKDTPFIADEENGVASYMRAMNRLASVPNRQDAY